VISDTGLEPDARELLGARVRELILVEPLSAPAIRRAGGGDAEDEPIDLGRHVASAEGGR